MSHNTWATSLRSQLVIFSKVAACTSQPVTFNEHLSTHGCLTDLRSKPQKKRTSRLSAVVLWYLVSLFMKLSIGDEKFSLPMCAYVAGFGKSSHNYMYAASL